MKLKIQMKASTSALIESKHPFEENGGLMKSLRVGAFKCASNIDSNLFKQYDDLKEQVDQLQIKQRTLKRAIQSEVKNYVISEVVRVGRKISDLRGPYFSEESNWRDMPRLWDCSARFEFTIDGRYRANFIYQGGKGFWLADYDLSYDTIEELIAAFEKGKDFLYEQMSQRVDERRNQAEVI
jgi:hypothetical protein